MKTKKILALKFLSFSIIMNAQVAMNAQDDSDKKQPTGSVSLNTGLSSPTGDFSNIKFGAASTGYNFHLNYSIPFFDHNHMGLTTVISTSGYGMIAEPFKDQQRSILNSVGYKEGIHYNLKSNNIGNYSEERILVGLYTTAPLTKRISLDSRILFGTIFIDRPKINIDLYDYYDDYYPTYTQAATSSTVFAYDFGLSVRCNLGKKHRLCLMVNLDYVGSSSASFDVNCKSMYVDKTSNSITDDGTNKITQSYSISSFNTTFGIGYVFGKK